MPRPRSVALIGRGLRRPRLCAAACQRLVAARHGRPHGRRLQPVEIACGAGLPLRLDYRAASAAGASLQPAPVHDLWRARLHPGRRACGIRTGIAGGGGVAGGLPDPRGADVGHLGRGAELPGDATRGWYVRAVGYSRYRPRQPGVRPRIANAGACCAPPLRWVWAERGRAFTNRLERPGAAERVKVLDTSSNIEPCACPSLHLLPLCCPAPPTPCLPARDGSSSPSGTAFERWCFATVTRSCCRAATRRP